jgi:hypothetical protein
MSHHPRARGGRALVLPLAITLALLCLAPTPGDIGGCGQPPEELDARLFYDTLETTDCRACQRCGLATRTCAAACEPHDDVEGVFPVGCAPLAHDGEVCLRRLQAAGCDEYAPYVADDEQGAVPLRSRPRPTECQFCPAR